MNIVFFTGAGVSAESGIQTFRDHKGNSNLGDFETLLTLSYFRKHPEKTWEWLNSFLKETEDAKPNKAHELIASIKADDVTVITQNIDTFHQKAGSPWVIELHGSIGHCICEECMKVHNGMVDTCECGGWTKPDFTFYEEVPNECAISNAEAAAIEADIFVIIGTSGQVYPAREMPFLAKKHGAKIYEINPGDSAFFGITEKKYTMKASEGMVELIKDLELDGSKEV